MLHHLARLPRRALPPLTALLVLLTGPLQGAPALAAEVPAPSPSTAATTGPALGVYRGAGGWGAERVPGYEAFLGRGTDYVLDFQATDRWDNLTWPSWQADAWKGRTVVLGAAGVFPGSWDRVHDGRPVGWAQAAAGSYDAHWRELGTRLVATGQAKAVLRGAHEFNGGWFPHRVHPEEAPAFVAAWRRWVDVLRSVPGQQFTFDWNPTLGEEWPLYAPETAYPGDAWVDRIALDVYDGWYTRGWTPGSAQPTQAERDEVWRRTLDGKRGLRFWRDFAAARGKRLSLPEWGLRVWKESDGLVHGGGDNASFVRRMAALIKDPAWLVDYHAFWEDPGKGVSDADAGRDVAVPEARAAFLAEFGGPASAPTSSATPAAPVVAPVVLPTVSPAVTPTAAPTVAPARTTSPTATPTPKHKPARTTSPLRPVRYRLLAPVRTRLSPQLSCRAVVAATPAQLRVLHSGNARRRGGSELDRVTVRKDLAVWLSSAGVQRAAFRLDGRAVRLDAAAPFDARGNDGGLARLLRRAALGAGVHRLDVQVQRGSTCLSRTVQFTIA